MREVFTACDTREDPEPQIAFIGQDSSSHTRKFNRVVDRGPRFCTLSTASETRQGLLVEYDSGAEVKINAASHRMSKVQTSYLPDNYCHLSSLL